MMGWGPRTFFGGGGSNPQNNPDRLDTGFQEFAQVNILAGQTADIISYTVPYDLIHLIRIEFGSENLGDYTLLIDGNLKARYITWNNGPMDGFWDFSIPTAGGLPLASGANIKVRANNFRKTAADYFARIYALRIDV